MSDLTARLVAATVALLVASLAWHLIGFPITALALLAWLVGSQEVRA